MKLIIDIDEQWYYQIKKENSFKCGNTLYDACIESVANGTPLEFGNITYEMIEELSHCPACIHYVQRDVPSVFCNNCKNRDELYRRINNET